MPELAPMSVVFKKENIIESDVDVPAETNVTVLFDAQFPLEPEFEEFSSDDNLTLKSVSLFKNKAVLQFNEIFHSGKQFNLKIKPKKMI